jgi:hypothetical protein
MFGIPYGAQLVPGSVLVTPTEGVEPRLATRPDALNSLRGHPERASLRHGYIQGDNAG